MITRDQLKADLDDVAESHLEVLHKIINAFRVATPQNNIHADTPQANFLKGSVTFENDLLSPISEAWDVEP